jgi:hypothetical protein
MSFWGVVWIVLMIIWLLGGGWYRYNQPAGQPGNPMLGYGISTILPWACVAILGAALLGGISVTTSMPMR